MASISYLQDLLRKAYGEQPEAPVVEAAPTMPDDDAARRAKRKSIAVQRARRGRLATIFTEDSGIGLGG